MTGLIERFRDVKMIAQTDKRVWSAVGFLAVVFLVWATTGAWREDPPEKEKTVRSNEKPHEDRLKNEIATFQRDLEANRQSRAEFSEALKRAEGDLQTNQQKMDWTLNTLVDKLDNMANRVDQLADKIGSRNVDNALIDKKLDAHRKQKKQTVKKVDQGEL